MDLVDKMVTAARCRTIDPPEEAPMSEPPKRKTAAELLKEAMAAKKASAPGGKTRLRADYGQAKAQKDAERIAGKSRKVH